MSERLDIERWKIDHPLPALVEQATGEQVRPGRNLRCPFHDDRTPSLTVFNDGRWRCWGCNRRGDALDWLGFTWFGDGYNLRDVIDRLGEIAPRLPSPVPMAGSPAPRAQPALRPTLNPGLVERFEKHMGERELAYWRRRGISPHCLYTHQVGWTGERYAFPWFYRGVLTAIKLRRDDERNPDLEPKYISVRGSRFAAPYNIDALTLSRGDLCLIVEDEKSALAATRYDLVAVAAPANQWHPEWSDMLSGVGDIVIVADRDDAGRASADKIKQTLRRARVLETWQGKDFFDFHEHMVKRIFDHDTIKSTIEEWLS